MTPRADNNRTTPPSPPRPTSTRAPTATTPDPAGRREAEEPVRLTVTTEDDLLTVRHTVRSASLRIGFGIVDQTRVVTAASELARNAYIHGGGGTLLIERTKAPEREGLRLTIHDDGPGIADIEKALTDGYSTGPGLGHGLGGARRLMDEFHLRSAPGRGTTVITTRWTR